MHDFLIGRIQTKYQPRQPLLTCAAHVVRGRGCRFPAAKNDALHRFINAASSPTKNGRSTKQKRMLATSVYAWLPLLDSNQRPQVGTWSHCARRRLQCSLSLPVLHLAGICHRQRSTPNQLTAAIRLPRSDVGRHLHEKQKQSTCETMLCFWLPLLDSNQRPQVGTWSHCARRRLQCSLSLPVLRLAVSAAGSARLRTS